MDQHRAAPFRDSADLPARRGVVALREQLRHVEEAESTDEATMDALAEAEERILTELAGTRATGLSELGLKLAILAGRVHEAEGQLTGAEMDLLWSTLRDLRRLDSGTAAALG